MVIGVTLRQLEAFVAVAENRSYIKASRSLGTSQPALTASILRLEELLGVRLFDRTTRTVALTGAGADFLAPIRSVLRDLSGAVGDLTELGERRRGRVFVACIPSIAARLVGPTVPDFLGRYPGVAVKIFEGDATSVAHHVRIHEADFGLSNAPEFDQMLKFTPILRDRWCAVCAHDHPMAAARQVRLSELAKYPVLALGRATGFRRLLDHAASKADIQLNIICESSQLSTLYGMIETGVGVSILPEASVPVTAGGRIVARKLTDPPVERDLGVITIRDRTLSPAAEAFRALLVERFPRVWRDFTAERYPTASPTKGRASFDP